MTRWVVDELGPEVPMHFSAFHPDFKLKDKKRTPPSTLLRAREIAMQNGVRYAYTGNIHNPEGDTTYCHSCGERVIGRNWYEITDWNLDLSGNCTHCGTQCGGVFENSPGKWGRKRQPVRLGDFR